MAIKPYTKIETVEDYMRMQGGDMDRAMPPPDGSFPRVIFEELIPYEFSGKARQLSVYGVGFGRAESSYTVNGDIIQGDDGKVHIDTLNVGEPERGKAMEKACRRRFRNALPVNIFTDPL